jgi:putative oxidoreductase
MNIASTFASLETFLTTIGTWLQSLLLLVIRLYWGWAFVQTGWGKLIHLSRTSEYFGGLGIPAPMVNAIAAGATECVGGALLAIGLFSRFAALALTGVLMVAYVTAEREALLAIGSNPDKFTESAPFLFLFAVLIVFAFGPGKLSLDAMARKKP